MAQPRQHADAAAEPDPNPAPETSYAERARTLLHISRQGVLSTHSKKRGGYPFGSVMPYALDGFGRPVFLVSSMAMHTQNLALNPRASLFVADPEAFSDPLGAARLTLLGDAVRVPQDELPVARELYLSRHDNARYYAGFKDFSFWRLEPLDLYYIGGFGVMGWVDVEDYASAAADPLAEASRTILEHVNQEHSGALLEIARHVKGIEADDARLTAVDRLGFHVRLKTADRVRSARIGFPREVRTAEECRKALIAMVQEARK